MQTLSDAQLNSLSPLGRELVDALRAGGLPALHEELNTDGVLVRIPAVSADVGDLEIVEDGDEYTLFVGRHTHTHFHPASLDRLLDHLQAIVRDEVVIWSASIGGGTFGVDTTDSDLPEDAEAWFWSGTAYHQLD